MRKDILAPLLVLTILVCHGAYGAMHQVMPEAGHAGMTPASATLMDEHSPSGAAHEEVYETAHGGILDSLSALLFPMNGHLHGDATAGGLAGELNHIAALLLVSAVAWLLAFAMSRREPPLLRGMGLRPYAAGLLHRPLQPSLARLQVLRL